MEDVNIKTIELGDKPPLIHRVSQPLLNERGIWIDADVTYNGRCHITITTRLNLLRLKRPPRPLVDPIHPTEATPDTGIQLNASLNSEDRSTPYDNVSNSAIFDSDAESLGSSSSESEGAHPENTPDTQHADGYAFKFLYLYYINVFTVYKDAVKLIVMKVKILYISNFTGVNQAMQGAYSNLWTV